MWDEGIRNNNEGEYNKISTEKNKTRKKERKKEKETPVNISFLMMRRGWIPSPPHTHTVLSFAISLL
jgi:hypothetical protein